MLVTITRSDLLRHAACRPGLAAFEAEFGDVYESAWRVEDQLRLLQSPLAGYVDWAQCKGLLPAWDFSDSDLTRASLVHANLTRANLTRADLTYANLVRADLIYASLIYANLTGANLTDANC